MNPTPSLQLMLPPPVKGVLTVSFSGPSTREDVVLFKEAIDAQLSAGSKLKKAIFDIVEIDPENNAAGRLLDLACFYGDTCDIPIEVRISEEIYAALQEITPEEMPPPPLKQADVRGVSVVVVPTPEEKASPPTSQRSYNVTKRSRVVLSCAGKVRAVSGSTVTVSLFIDGDEIIGEFEQSQFPKAVTPDMVFDYQAVVTAPGKTEILIDSVTEQQPTTDELLDLAKDIAHDIGLKKRHQRDTQ